MKHYRVDELVLQMVNCPLEANVTIDKCRKCSSYQGEEKLLTHLMIKCIAKDRLEELNFR